MPESKSSATPPPAQPRSRPGIVRWGIAIVLLAFAGWAGWHTYRVFAQRSVAQYIDDLGGVVYYDFQDIDPDNSAERTDGPGVIASMLGNDYTHDIVDVTLRRENRGSVTDDDLRKISVLSAVRKLSISNGSEVSDEGLAVLAKMPKLQVLKLVKFPNITDGGLELIARLPDLRELELVALPKITDEGLRHAAQLANLKKLTVTNCEINGSGLQYLKTEELRLVDTTHCHLNDSALKHLSGASNLEELSVAQNEIQGDGLSHLKNLGKLSKLRLGENPLKPSMALPPLKSLSNLTLLNVAKTDIKQPEGEELSKALPQCDIFITGGSYDSEEGKWFFDENP